VSRNGTKEPLAGSASSGTGIEIESIGARVPFAAGSGVCVRSGCNRELAIAGIVLIEQTRQDRYYSVGCNGFPLGQYVI